MLNNQNLSPTGGNLDSGRKVSKGQMRLPHMFSLAHIYCQRGKSSVWSPHFFSRTTQPFCLEKSTEPMQAMRNPLGILSEPMWNPCGNRQKTIDFALQICSSRATAGLSPPPGGEGGLATPPAQGQGVSVASTPSQNKGGQLKHFDPVFKRQFRDIRIRYIRRHYGGTIRHRASGTRRRVVCPMPVSTKLWNSLRNSSGVLRYSVLLL